MPSYVKVHGGAKERAPSGQAILERLKILHIQHDTKAEAVRPAHVMSQSKVESKLFGTLFRIYLWLVVRAIDLNIDRCCYSVM